MAIDMLCISTLPSPFRKILGILRVGMLFTICLFAFMLTFTSSRNVAHLPTCMEFGIFESTFTRGVFPDASTNDTSTNVITVFFKISLPTSRKHLGTRMFTKLSICRNHSLIFSATSSTMT